MPEDNQELIELFQSFVEWVLVSNELPKALEVVTDDAMGIGMGDQGMVNSKADVERVLSKNKGGRQVRPTIHYEQIQVRCYEEKFATVCGLLVIHIEIGGKKTQSTLGQMINCRRVDGQWRICMLQATPLFKEIEEMEAYPIKFAENVLEKYREQEQIAKNAQSGNVAIYRVNYTKGIFEDAVLKSEDVIKTKPGDQYERTIIFAARERLSEEAGYHFISTFSVGNVFNAYHNGQTELSMEYEMRLDNGRYKWMRTVLKLYMDRADENLKGYLYVVDINKEKSREAELQSRVELDSLTEILNQKYVGIKVEEKLKNVSCSNQGAFYMIDLDHFKEINDTYGHHEGDRIIKETVSCMNRLLRSGDLAGRLGGDEFCIYFGHGMTKETAIRAAQRLCQAVRQITLPDGETVSCSVGVVMCSNPNNTFDEVYQKADQALYEQKRTGRDGYTII